MPMLSAIRIILLFSFDISLIFRHVYFALFSLSLMPLFFAAFAFRFLLFVFFFIFS